MEFYTNSSNTSTVVTYSGGVPGSTSLAVGTTDLIDCFHLFLSSDIYDELLVQTNLYADQQRAAAKNDTGRWTPISKEELMAFIMINIAMGLVSLPTLDDYWSSDPILDPHMVLYCHGTKSIPTDFTIS